MFNISNFEKYISSVSYDLKCDLKLIYEEAKENHVPVIREPELDILRVILEMKKPKKILELGTAVGFSGSFMIECLGGNTFLTTIERNSKRIEKAKENFKKLDIEDKVALLEGDATEIVNDIEEKFDLIFLDSAKGSYKELLPKLILLLNEGGVLLTDNIIQEGELLLPRSLINQRDRTTYDRMRSFAYDLFHTKEIVTSVIPCGDGMAISVLK